MLNNGIELRVGYVEPRDVLLGCRLGVCRTTSKQDHSLVVFSTQNHAV